jgi:hypothetical protein
VLDLAPAVVAVLAVTAAFKLLELRRRFIPAQAALAAVFVALAIGVAPLAGLDTQMLGDTATVRGWGDVLSRACIALAAGLAQVYLLLLAVPSETALAGTRPRILTAGLVAVVLLVLGTMTPAHAFGSEPLDAWTEAGTHIVFLVYVALALTDVTVSAIRWAQMSRGALRTGLSLIAAGAGSAIAYAVIKGLCVAVEMTGDMPPGAAVEAARAAALVGLLLVSAGCVLPALDRGLRAARHAVAIHRLLDRLYPLWSDLVDVVPGIALEAVEPRWRDRLHVRDLDLRLYRRIIEIRDGQLALSQPRNPASRSGTAHLHIALAPSADTPSPLTTVEEEVAWWTRVASSYERLRESDVPAG